MAATVLTAWAAVCLPLVVTVTAVACPSSVAAPSDVAADQVPDEYLALYRDAGADSGLPWQVLAAIGWIETRHGTLRAPGVTTGQNPYGAAGPMQFGIGGRAGNTWGGEPVRPVPPHLGYGVDGDGDGVADVYNPADAIPAAAAYLTDHGAPGDLRRALFAYNHAGWYVDKVLTKAAEYGAGGEAVDTRAGVVAAGCHGESGGVAGTGPGAWGGHGNGRIPLGELCAVDAAAIHLLRCDAARDFVAMSHAHEVALGRPLELTDAYRDFDDQVAIHHAKPDLAATPGRSNHGWGLAVDLVVGGFSGGTFQWLQNNAAFYGWHHPPWAAADGSKPEPWHWEYEKERQ